MKFLLEILIVIFINAEYMQIATTELERSSFIKSSTFTKSTFLAQNDHTNSTTTGKDTDIMENIVTMNESK